MENLKGIGETLKKAVKELTNFAKLEKGSILVVGCSTSEVIERKLELLARLMWLKLFIKL